MPYFQNVYNQDFMGVYVISDRQYSKTYKVKANVNSPTLMTNWNVSPYNTTVANLFGIKYSMDAGITYNQLNVSITASSATSAVQIVTDLNNNANFAGMFTASYSMDQRFVTIRANSNFTNTFRAYIPNITDPSNPLTSAEIALGFNMKASVVQLPSFFTRQIIGNAPNAILVQLSQPNENFVIANAGLSLTPLADWQMLAGTSGYFTFKRQSIDASGRITQIIEFPAGAGVGDVAKKTQYVYSGANTNPSFVSEIPYTLTSSDLFSPPYSMSYGGSGDLQLTFNHTTNA